MNIIYFEKRPEISDTKTDIYNLFIDKVYKLKHFPE